MEIGYLLSSEELGPTEQVSHARQAEEAGFRSLWISDHFHPWTDRQGQSPFVWAVIGGIASTTKLRVTTGVTCPTVRIHPAIIAQAAATAAIMLPGRFNLGVGSGEALNEHILGDRWPPVDVRLEMLEEAVGLMRDLWTGELVNHDGPYYLVENARLYTRPGDPPPVIVSGTGPKATSLAARIGDGYCNTTPAPELVRQYVEEGGQGPKQAGMKACWGTDEAAARKLAHELWAVQFLPGQLGQELPMPSHFEAGTQLVSEEMVAETIPCGPDPERHAAAVRTYADAGFDEVYVSQIGPDQGEFLDFYRREVIPRV
jgi:G6PDH family F420-dependent oxidoreductase